MMMMMMIDDCPSVFTQKLPLDSGLPFVVERQIQRQIKYDFRPQADKSGQFFFLLSAVR